MQHLSFTSLAQAPAGSSNMIWIVLGIVLVLVFLIAAFVIGQFFKLWIQAYFSNAKVSMIDLIGMRLRSVDLRTIVLSRIRAVKAGLEVPTAKLETHYLAGGSVPRVISALIAARGALHDLSGGSAQAQYLGPHRAAGFAAPSLPQFEWILSNHQAVAQRAPSTGPDK